MPFSIEKGSRGGVFGGDPSGPDALDLSLAGLGGLAGFEGLAGLAGLAGIGDLGGSSGAATAVAPALLLSCQGPATLGLSGPFAPSAGGGGVKAAGATAAGAGAAGSGDDQKKGPAGGCCWDVEAGEPIADNSAHHPDAQKWQGEAAAKAAKVARAAGAAGRERGGDVVIVLACPPHLLALLNARPGARAGARAGAREGAKGEPSVAAFASLVGPAPCVAPPPRPAPAARPRSGRVADMSDAAWGSFADQSDPRLSPEHACALRLWPRAIKVSTL